MRSSKRFKNYLVSRHSKSPKGFHVNNHGMYIPWCRKDYGERATQWVNIHPFQGWLYPVAAPCRPRDMHPAVIHIETLQGSKEKRTHSISKPQMISIKK